MTIDLIKLSGDHYELGVQQGRFCQLLFGKLNIMKIMRDLNFVQAAKPIGGAPFNYIFGKLMSRGGRRMLKTIASFFPNQYDRIEGMAEGNGITAEKLSQFLYFENFSGDCKNDMNSPTQRGLGCTASIIKKNDQIFLIKNFDFPYELEEYQTIRYSHFTNNSGYDNVTAGIIAVPHAITGINEKGLALSINSGYSTDIKHSAVPSGVLTQECLETCETADEAKEIILDVPLSAGWIFLIIDKNGVGYVIEKTHSKKAVREFTEYHDGQYLVASNSLIAPETKAMQVPDDTLWTMNGDLKDAPVIKHAEYRRKRMENLVKDLLANKNSKDSIKLEDLRKILADHENMENDPWNESICRHSELYKTLSSIIIDLNSQTCYSIDGNPCSNNPMKKYEVKFDYLDQIPNIRFMRRKNPECKFFDPLIG
ncbi:MAG: hypothetical protein GF364_18905 [Candidatus Lokiarchaeota archaeon]|nr:hypothetical protein [Candidatus Lokiarchaeota archaeon]